MKISFCEYTIDTEMALHHIDDLVLEIQLNHHARLDLFGLMNTKRCSLSDIELRKRNVISLYDKNIKLVFHGKVETLEVDRLDQGITQFHLIAYSLTKQLDCTVRNRTFQNLDMTYADILNQITQQYTGVNYIASVDVDRKIPHLLIQYEETDWQFLLRLASHFHACLIPSENSYSGNFYFGKKRSEALSQPHDFNGCWKQTKTINHLNQTEDIRYTMRQNKKYDICTIMNIQENELMITRILLCFDKGLSTCCYTLENPQVIGLDFLTNKKIKGLKLYGTVNSILRNKMRIHFEMDNTYKNHNNVWIPYAGGENNEHGFYLATPGSNAEISFPDDHEERCFISATVRDQSLSKENCSNPSTKVWNNNFGQRASLSTKQVELATDKNTTHITLNKNGAVAISGTDINIVASNNFKIGTPKHRPKNITICAKNKILLSDKTHLNSILLTENCDVVCNASQKIVTMGTSTSNNTDDKNTTNHTKTSENKNNKILDSHNSKQEQINELRCATFSFAAVDFISSALEPENTNYSYWSDYMKTISAGFSSPPFSKTREQNPMCDHILGGNMHLFDALSYGECVNN